MILCGKDKLNLYVIDWGTTPKGAEYVCLSVSQGSASVDTHNHKSKIFKKKNCVCTEHLEFLCHYPLNLQGIKTTIYTTFKFTFMHNLEIIYLLW